MSHVDKHIPSVFSSVPCVPFRTDKLLVSPCLAQDLKHYAHYLCTLRLHADRCKPHASLNVNIDTPRTLIAENPYPSLVQGKHLQMWCCATWGYQGTALNMRLVKAIGIATLLLSLCTVIMPLSVIPDCTNILAPNVTSTLPAIKPFEPLVQPRPPSQINSSVRALATC